MSITSSDPIEVLRSLRIPSNARVVTDDDFATPVGDDVRALAVAVPGLIHPAHFEWVAEILGRSQESLVEALSSIHDGNGLSAVSQALREAKMPARLSALGVTADELIIQRVPVTPATLRPNVEAPSGARKVMSPLNAAYQELFRWSRSVQKLTDLGGPEIIIEARALSMMGSFERLLRLLGGKGHRFTPQYQPNTSAPTPPELVVMPRCRTAGLMCPPTTPREVRLVGATALIRFPVALACVDVNSGQFSVQPFAEAQFAAVNDSEAVFCDGSRLSVLDLNRRQFVIEPRQVPPRITLGACCGVEVLDTASRTTALLPGPMASSGFDFVTSACGRYGWLDVAPQVDELGVFSVEDIARVCRVWPHATIGTPAEVEDLGEGHDDTPRALARLDDGSFRFVYGHHLLHGPHAYQLPQEFKAVGFDLTGTKLAVVDLTHLSVFALSALGEPTLIARRSLAPLAEHLTADRFDFTNTGLNAEAIMAATGTIETLAGLDPQELSELVFFDEEPKPEALERLIAEARALKLQTSLEPG